MMDPVIYNFGSELRLFLFLGIRLEIFPWSRLPSLTTTQVRYLFRSSGEFLDQVCCIEHLFSGSLPFLFDLFSAVIKHLIWSDE